MSRTSGRAPCLAGRAREGRPPPGRGGELQPEVGVQAAGANGEDGGGEEVQDGVLLVGRLDGEAWLPGGCAASFPSTGETHSIALLFILSQGDVRSPLPRLRDPFSGTIGC